MCNKFSTSAQSVFIVLYTRPKNVYILGFSSTLSEYFIFSIKYCFLCRFCTSTRISAVEIPLFLYVGMLFNQMKRSGDLRSAFLLVNSKLGDDGGEGWLFLVGLFVFGLVMSMSFARKNGQSISYRLLSKITKTSREDGAQG